MLVHADGRVWGNLEHGAGNVLGRFCYLRRAGARLRERFGPLLLPQPCWGRCAEGKCEGNQGPAQGPFFLVLCRPFDRLRDRPPSSRPALRQAQGPATAPGPSTGSGTGRRPGASANSATGPPPYSFSIYTFVSR